jgi:hypothetical protein
MSLLPIHSLFRNVFVGILVVKEPLRCNVCGNNICFIYIIKKIIIYVH